MANASYAVGSFLGGEISAYAQGRFDKPDYRISLKVCFNAFPVEIGPWTRRPGTMHAGHTKAGRAGRVFKFDFEQANAVTCELTDGYLRFRSGAVLIDTNESAAVTTVSAADPAVVQLTTAVTWASGVTLLFDAVSPLLQGRQLIGTRINSTHFSLTDAVTGAAVDGADLGTVVPGTVRCIHELTTAYIGGLWSGIRAVQAETTDILLCGNVAPQALIVSTLPTQRLYPQFSIAAATFNDGPYLDPFTNGVLATPSAAAGIITLTLSFPPYAASRAYKVGDFVTDSSVNYRSLQAQNVGNTPAGSPTYWAVAQVSEAINGGRGFLGSDIGRQVRLFSEPATWATGSSYSIGSVVSYNPTGLPGATQYWSSLVNSNTGNYPGKDLINWTLIAGNAALWTWGRITGLSTIIDRALAGSASIGDMTGGGGLAAAFDGVFSQAAAAAAESSSSSLSALSYALTSYVGKNYAGAADQAVMQATVYPANDTGFFAFVATGMGLVASQVTFNLRGKASAPGNSADGTLLGTVTVSNGFAAVTITSNDQATAWKYVWVEQITTVTVQTITSGGGSYTLTNAIAELSLFNPPGTGTGSGASVEILGPALPYTLTITTWRLGAYSNTTGWPTCGTYYEGRLWLAGAIKNRFDGSVSNGIVGSTINFAPTDQNGAVSTNNALNYTLNSDSVNPIFAMKPDLQGIVVFTQAGEYLVLAPTTGPLAPNNITARRITRVGSANIEPQRTEHTNIFVQRYHRKLLEHFADAYSGKFTAPNLADKAGHITAKAIAELAYTEAVTPIIWGRCDDGSLFGITYKRDTMTTAQPPAYAGWHRHALGSGRTVESVCSGPSPGGDLDALTMVTNDAATGIHHVEILTDMFDETAALADAWMLDNAANPTSIAISGTVTGDAPAGSVTLYGLWHHNGETVQVFAGGLDCGDPGEGNAFADFTVTDGALTISFGDGISSGAGRGLFTADFVASLSLSQIVVGFTYNSDGQLLRPMSPADSGARNGPAFAKLTRGHRYGMKVVNTLGLSVGGDLAKKLYPAKFLTEANKAIPALTTYSGIVQDTLQDDYGYEGGAPAWRVSRPWPATVVIVGSNLATQDQ